MSETKPPETTPAPAGSPDRGATDDPANRDVQPAAPPPEAPRLDDTRREALSLVTEAARELLREIDPDLADALTTAQVAVIVAVLESRN